MRSIDAPKYINGIYTHMVLCCVSNVRWCHDHTPYMGKCTHILFYYRFICLNGDLLALIKEIKKEQKKK